MNSLTVSPGLRRADFTRIAERGFDDGLNSYAHTMAWFQDHLYVGTTRANLCLVRVANPNAFSIWPTNCPGDVYSLDLRAQIWRYDPHAHDWERVFQSPTVAGAGGQRVPRELGYRGMAVFRAHGHSQPALYVANWATGRSGRAPVVLRSDDGSNFEAIATLGTDPNIFSYRVLLPLDGSLFTSPTGRAGRTANVSEMPVVLASPDPATNPWQMVSPPGFGDQTNGTVFELLGFNDHLYAGTLNPTRGFQLWKTRLAEGLPYTWKQVLRDGAYRGKLNQGISTMCVFNNALYIGTGIQGGGYDRTQHIGPAAAEMLRVHPDDTWDLVVGSPRQTPDGFKSPVARMGPGFDNLMNGYIWRIAVHDGWLYAGTYNWGALLPYLSTQRWPPAARRWVQGIGTSALADNSGFHLWRTSDGSNWIPVTRNGFENPYNYGVRTLVSTPHGLFLGTANPFGPEIGVETPGGVRYVPNPRGGLEIWLGSSQDVPERSASPLVLSPVLRARDSDGRPPAGFAATPAGIVNSFYHETMYSQLWQELYEGSGFFNYGYWNPGTRSQAEACENLIEMLLESVPRRPGTILDVACGLGATANHLLKYYPPAAVTGIDISEKQVAASRENVPGCTFLVMDATQLHFANDSFDTVICVEAAFHFRTRERFLREVLRVLRPGGQLVLSDILVARWAEASNPLRTIDNFLIDLEEYRSLLAKVGFERMSVADATHMCYEPFLKHFLQFLDDKFWAREINWRTLNRLRQVASVVDAGTRSYVLVAAHKGR